MYTSGRHPVFRCILIALALVACAAPMSDKEIGQMVAQAENQLLVVKTKLVAAYLPDDKAEAEQSLAEASAAVANARVSFAAGDMASARRSASNAIKVMDALEEKLLDAPVIAPPVCAGGANNEVC